MQIEKTDKEVINGMALYVEECMQELRFQLVKDEVDMKIIARRAERANQTINVLFEKIAEMVS